VIVWIKNEEGSVPHSPLKFLASSIEGQIVYRHGMS
jgi:hypothetical protein